MKELIKKVKELETNKCEDVDYILSMIYDVTGVIRLSGVNPKQFEVIYNYLNELSAKANNVDDAGVPVIYGPHFTETEQERLVNRVWADYDDNTIPNEVMQKVRDMIGEHHSEVMRMDVHRVMFSNEPDYSENDE